MAERIDGPASPKDKILWKELKRRGILEEELPKELRDAPVAKSKKGPLGQLVVKNMTGLVRNGTSKIVRRFEQNIGGKEDLVEKLEGLGDDLTKEGRKFLNALIVSGQKSVARVMAETGVDPAKIMKLYMQGCIELGKYEAAILAHENLPAITKEYVKAALSQKGYCDACGGSGKRHSRAGAHADTEECGFCEGKGMTLESPMKEAAMGKVLEITKVVGKGDGISITTNVGVKVEAGKGSSVFERVMAAGDEVLYRKDRTGQVVDAEVIEAEGV